MEENQGTKKNRTTEYSFCVETESINNAKKLELEEVITVYSEFGSGAAKETILGLKNLNK